jgi:hypothetical protein
MSKERADSIAYYAVREAYVEGIPPAVVFGVMLTENAQFVSGAMSSVGAVGLMQIYPKIWLKELRARFGSDLASDSTNLKYGIYILKQYIKSDSGKVTPSNLSRGCCTTTVACSAATRRIARRIHPRSRPTSRNRGARPAPLTTSTTVSPSRSSPDCSAESRRRSEDANAKTASA